MVDSPVASAAAMESVAEVIVDAVTVDVVIVDVAIADAEDAAGAGRCSLSFPRISAVLPWQATLLKLATPIH